MATTKLYYENAFLQDFTAAVESCGAVKDGFAVVLDRTAFYPEGGGQPADHGTLGEARVLDVQEHDGVITHLCDRDLPVGAEVSGHIDWARRFDFMQQHSGEHILSGLLCSTFRCDNVGFHMGADVVTIDYNADFTWEQALEVERRANAYIWEDHPVHIWYPDPEELAALPYRSKKALTGSVRLTEFPGADLCACCGTHVQSSGQVGLVKLTGYQKFRDGVRLELLCGQRASDYLSRCWEQSRLAGQALSVKPTDLAPAVNRLQSELTALKEKTPGWRSSPSPASPPNTMARGTCCSSPIRWRATASAACATRCPKAPEAAAPCSPAQTARTATPSSARRTSPRWSRP